jgi:putative addiction module component (TIGR02574 family)
MPETVEKLKAELGKLTTRERAEIAHFLLHTLDPQEDEDVEAAWDQELDKRAKEIDSGKVVGKPVSPVIRRAKKQRRVVLPLVPSDKPGSVDLTNERISEILQEQDATS